MAGQPEGDRVRPRVVVALLTLVLLSVAMLWGVWRWVDSFDYSGTHAGLGSAEFEQGADPEPPGTRRVPRIRAVEAVPLPAHPFSGSRAVVYPTDSTEDDPQTQASRRSYPFAPDAGGGPPFARMRSRGRVESVSGNSPVAVGATCEVRVLPVQSGGFNCLVRVVCDGKLLYPNSELTAGYTGCTVDHGLALSASDSMPTNQDMDPRVSFDLRTARAEVSDGDIDSSNGVSQPFRATIALDES